MSIELENPETVLGKVDAAANYVEQISLAFTIGDRQRVEFAISEARRLLSTALEQIEEADEEVLETIDAMHAASLEHGTTRESSEKQHAGYAAYRKLRARLP